MSNSKCKNVAKARVFNILKRNFPGNPREAESIAVGETVFRNLAAERQTNNEIDDTTVDNAISDFSLITC